MSFSRTMYDSCAYKKTVTESTGTLAYMLDPVKYEVCSSKKCSVNFGVSGGASVRQPKRSLVEIESELLNLTRPASRCPSKKYAPKCSKPNSNDDNGLPCGPYQLQSDNNNNNLKGCYLATYKPKATQVGYSLPSLSCHNNNNITNN